MSAVAIACADEAEPAYARAREQADLGRLKLHWAPWLDVPPRPLGTDVDVADKVEGMLLGLAIGDALGNTTESLNPEDRRQLHGWISGYLPNRHADGRAVGLPSDDTQMAFWTLEQLLDDGALNPDHLAAIFCQRPIYGIGQTVRRFRANHAAGLRWPACGVESAGNGALMRIAPVLLPHLRAPSRELWGETLVAASLTHDDLLSNASCLAFVRMLWTLLGLRAAPDGAWWIDTWLAASETLTAGRADGVFTPSSAHPAGFAGSIADLVQQHVRPALARDLEVAATGDIWHSGAHLLQTVPTVLYVLTRHGHDPAEAILQAVNGTRDNDSCAAIVGAAAGALHGASRLPGAWLDGLLGRTMADDDGEVFRRLAQAGERYGYGITPSLRQRAVAAGWRAR